MTLQIPEGARVFVQHLRFADNDLYDDGLYSRQDMKLLGIKPAAKGGLTLAQIEFDDGRTFRGAAKCTRRDNYNKSIGRLIATGRALKSAAVNG